MFSFIISVICIMVVYNVFFKLDRPLKIVISMIYRFVPSLAHNTSKFPLNFHTTPQLMGTLLEKFLYYFNYTCQNTLH